VFEAAESFARTSTPLVVNAGREYGTGSSRDWAAKATALLGVRAVLARSFERIHRSNLLQLGVLPLEFVDGQHPESLGLHGIDDLDIVGVRAALTPRSRVVVRARTGTTRIEFEALARIDTVREAEHLRHGGILPFVLRRLLAA